MQMDFHSIKAFGDMVLGCDQKSVLVALPFRKHNRGASGEDRKPASISIKAWPMMEGHRQVAAGEMGVKWSDWLMDGGMQGK